MRLDKLVLVVDDNRAVRDTTAALLELEGYAVTVAANGREALDFLNTAGVPFAILLDLRMPILNGWEFHTQLRQTPSLAEVPIILISAEGDLPTIARELGVAGHFRKPFVIDQLIDSLRSLHAARTSPIGHRGCGSGPPCRAMPCSPGPKNTLLIKMVLTFLSSLLR